MIFRRKAKAEPVDEPDEEVTDTEAADGEAEPDAVASDDAEIDDAEIEAEGELDPDELPAELSDDEELPEEPEFDPDTDWRFDGPFDHDEVDLAADEVERLDLGSLILTPWEGMGLQLQVNEATQQVVAALAFWEQSGLELALLAAPTSGGLAEELREDLTEEAQQAGGSASTVVGPFGPELRRVLPAEGPSGEQLFQVSRTWFAEGPRWLLRGTLLGEAGLTEDDEGAAAPFVEFFRNVVVRRGDGPMVPGEVIGMTMPTVPQG
ncbi:MAG: DUF3710 domain-containing protein [Micropruina sp.]|uniref:DUF3710 domain-containing protein n=1 Tax=Micropruina sp. TaxID=2737536 RepID=UPI0039E50ECB